MQRAEKDPVSDPSARFFLCRLTPARKQFRTIRAERFSCHGYVTAILQIRDTRLRRRVIGFSLKSPSYQRGTHSNRTLKPVSQLSSAATVFSQEEGYEPSQIL